MVVEKVPFWIITIGISIPKGAIGRMFTAVKELAVELISIPKGAIGSRLNANGSLVSIGFQFQKVQLVVILIC